MDDVKINQGKVQHMRMGAMDFVIEAVYGSEPLDEILADYTSNKIREGNVLDEAA